LGGKLSVAVGGDEALGLFVPAEAQLSELGEELLSRLVGSLLVARVPRRSRFLLGLLRHGYSFGLGVSEPLESLY
jgi:hypothetical protein